jgi:hypothetical protein
MICSTVQAQQRLAGYWGNFAGLALMQTGNRVGPCVFSLMASQSHISQHVATIEGHAGPQEQEAYIHSTLQNPAQSDFAFLKNLSILIAKISRIHSSLSLPAPLIVYFNHVVKACSDPDCDCLKCSCSSHPRV